VLLKTTGEVKLGDFGISRIFTDDTTSLIKSNAGTRKYMSPEMMSDQFYSYNTDCWLFFY
jgi:serine/threonine protein kinase